MSKYYRPPVKNADTQELVLFIMDNGLGRPSQDGFDAEHWPTGYFADALTDLGQPVSEATIQNWRSGKHPPSLANIRSLAALVSNTAVEREEWLDALRYAAILLKKRKSPKLIPAPLVSKNSTSNSELGQHYDFPKGKKYEPKLHSSRIVLIMLSLSISLAISTYLVVIPGKKPRIDNFKICDRSNFSRATKKCFRHMTTLPNGTKTVFTSFDLVNVPEGSQFERVWLRCGHKIHSKPSRNVAPWEGWTWFAHDDFVKQGPFALNIIAGEEVAVQKFSIGNPNKENCMDF